MKYKYWSRLLNSNFYVTVIRYLRKATWRRRDESWLAGSVCHGEEGVAEQSGSSTEARKQPRTRAAAEKRPRQDVSTRHSLRGLLLLSVPHLPLLTSSQ